MTTAVDSPPPSRPTTPRAVSARRGRRRRTRTLQRTLLLIFFLVVVLIPAYVLLVTSFKGPATPARRAHGPCPSHWDDRRLGDAPGTRCRPALCAPSRW